MSLVLALVGVTGQAANAHQLTHRNSKKIVSPVSKMNLQEKLKFYKRNVMHAKIAVAYWQDSGKRWCFNRFHPRCAQAAMPELGWHKRLLQNATRNLNYIEKRIENRKRWLAYKRRLAYERRLYQGVPSWIYNAFQCIHTHEGDWKANTGNGFYGGLQFLTSTWLSAGGGRFAPRADLASPIQQITVAYWLWKSSGFHPWPNTARMCGYL